MKSSIFSDDSYNTMVYEWRKVEEAPVVRVVEVASLSEINSFTGLAFTRKTIKPEPVKCQLNTLTQLSREELLLVLRHMLDGHQSIFKKLRATSVSLEKSVITAEGKVKVWVNQHLERNDISGEILNREEDIVQRIFESVGVLSSTNG
jgi:hypothetical protein